MAMFAKLVLHATFAILILSITPIVGIPSTFAEKNDVLVLNLATSPSIRVGDLFSINGTIVNNSGNAIMVHNGCGGPFAVLFDSHAQVEVQKVCNWMAVQILLQPGESYNATSLMSNLGYRAISAGAANATVSITYEVRNQSGTQNPVTVSKPISFTINSSEVGKKILPPIKQLRMGVLAEDVQCNPGLQLVFKASDGSPNCVKTSSVDTLVMWGWAKLPDGGTMHPETSIRTITLADNGKSISMHKGDRFLLQLGSSFNWDVTVDNPSVVSRVVNIMVVKGAQGVYESHDTGSAKVVAIGNPVCLNAPVPCKMASILFRLDVTVA